VTLEQLLVTPLSAEELTDEQLDAICKDFWPKCRPEFVPKEEPKKSKKSLVKKIEDSDLEATKQFAMKLAAAHGIKLKL
jgi:hypothetical protein